MYLRRCYRSKGGKRHAYWALVESYRTAHGPRQRVVAWLGTMQEASCRGVAAAASDRLVQGTLDGIEASSVRINPKSIRVEHVRDFGAPWLGLQMARELGLPSFLEERMPAGREQVPWPLMSLVLVLGRLMDPSSELHLAEHLYEHTAMAELLGVPAEKVNDDRLYRALDALLPHKAALQKHLKERMGELFDLKYDLLLYDVTSTYFEGQCEANPQAQRGYSRDHRPDCKQVCVALIVSRYGMPVGYEVFAGNRTDVTTVEEMVEKIESLYGKADRVWVMDRGMTSRENVEFLKEGGRRYILGTSKGELKKYERHLLEKDWTAVHEGLEVKEVASPDQDQETFILCRSADRREKEKAMHEKFMHRIEKGLESIRRGCESRRQDPMRIAHRVGRLLGKNTRAEGAFAVTVQADESDGRAVLSWKKNEQWLDWSMLSEGCYLLRTNIPAGSWTPPELWRAYMQLTQAESAFRIHKSDLELRPVWHQKQARVEAHILVCFLAYVLWKTLAAMCQRAGLGDEPRKVLEELGRIKVVDVVMRTDTGLPLRRRCVSQPTDHQAILLHRLGLILPEHLPLMEQTIRACSGNSD